MTELTSDAGDSTDTPSAKTPTAAPAQVMAPANYKQVIARFARLPEDVHAWIPEVGDLITNYDWDVSIAFVFAKIEANKHVTLYRGLVRRHRTDAELTWDLLQRDHMSRSRFLQLFTTVFGKPLPKPVVDRLNVAEHARDKVMHGKALTGAEARISLLAAFDFMEEFNEAVFKIAEFRPYGDARGFKGRAESLSKETSRWVLRGMGIPATAPRGDD